MEAAQEVPYQTSLLCTVYIVNFEQKLAGVISSTLKEFFPENNRPACTWIRSTAPLAVSDFLVEIEATAVLE